ncbi:MAG TPA: KH domain-containing protein [Candidatus Polarisedimenticolia bacterium]|nr:KH domain-containing protein [Candidatus Polarisedimenticolia bacterium]
MPVPELQQWIAEMARDLVDRPDAVAVEVVEEEGATVFELEVDPEEMGRIIGRQGRTVQALRTLLALASARDGRNYELEILE